MQKHGRESKTKTLNNIITTDQLEDYLVERHNVPLDIQLLNKELRGLLHKQQTPKQFVVCKGLVSLNSNYKPPQK